MKPFRLALLVAAIAVILPHLHAARSSPSANSTRRFVLSRADYEDRVQAIWTGQMIGQWTGLQFEHQVASVLNPTPLRHPPGHAPIDDDYYYEIVAIRAFEKYGVHLTVEQLGAQWLENNAGSWGSSEQALLLLKRGIRPPDTGSPRYNKLWWTIGPQFSSDVYGALNPGMPNDAAAMARRLTHMNGYAEGTDGAVFISGMISLGFVESDTKKIVRQAAHLVSPLSPYRQCLDTVIRMADSGKPPDEILRTIDERWGIEYPATNNAVLNGGIVAVAVWFGQGDFLRTENLAFSAADFADTDCNAANAASVVAAMGGMRVLPAELVSDLHDRIFGPTMGPLTLTPPVDESISALARRTARIGERILVSNGAKVDANRIVIPLESVRPLAPELFRLSDLTRWWNPDWKLERAGFGSGGGGIRGIRGNTYLDGEVLAVWPRDEVRGALLRRTMHVDTISNLTFDAGADPGSVWHLVVFVNDQKLIDREIDGGSLPAAGVPAERHWEGIDVDLGPFKNQQVVIRLYDLVLVPHQYAGNSYWRRLEVH